MYKCKFEVVSRKWTINFVKIVKFVKFPPFPIFCFFKVKLDILDFGLLIRLNCSLVVADYQPS